MNYSFYEAVQITIPNTTNLISMMTWKSILNAKTMLAESPHLQEGALCEPLELCNNDL